MKRAKSDAAANDIWRVHAQSCARFTTYNSSVAQLNDTQLSIAEGKSQKRELAAAYVLSLRCVQKYN